MTPESTTPTLPEDTYIGRVALQVSDLPKVAEFYRTVVGLEILSQDESMATLGVGHTPLLVLLADSDAGEREQSAAGLFHTAFRVPSRSALGEALARVREHSRLDGGSDHRVSEALYLTDPEGNGVEIYRDRPRDGWPYTEAGLVAMTTEALDIEGVAAAATAGENSRAPPGTDIGHVHLEVSALDGFEEFYVDTLGFDVEARVQGASFVAAGGYHHHIGANVWQSRTAPAEGRGLSWFEIVVPGKQALAAVRERATERGQSITENERGFAVTDSDGIEIRFRAGEPSES